MKTKNNKSPIQYDFYFGASSELIQRAKSLRANETKTEILLWHRLKDKSKFPIRWRRQHPAHKFIFDFYCPYIKLPIEVDGDSHTGNIEEFYDNDRDEIMMEFGVKTIRFSNDEILYELDRVERLIIEEVYNRLIELGKKEIE